MEVAHVKLTVHRSCPPEQKMYPFLPISMILADNEFQPDRVQAEKEPSTAEAQYGVW